MSDSAPSHPDPDKHTIHVLLLKTKSTPTDAYEERFPSPPFKPVFVPVLEHAFDEDGVAQVRGILRGRRIGSTYEAGKEDEDVGKSEGRSQGDVEEGRKYGGLVFTSQRAVEAFTAVVKEGIDHDPSHPHLANTPIYTVGPATTRALRAVPLGSAHPPLTLLGEHTGNGDALAQFVLTDYAERYPDPNPPPLLFLVGETRRDVIPRTLAAASPPVRVDEVVVYGTGVREDFGAAFAEAVEKAAGLGGAAGGQSVGTGIASGEEGKAWVVVFSPTGGRGVLSGLGLLDESTGRAREESAVKRRRRRVRVVAIGPTTRDWMRREYGFEVDGTAEKPSPEGVCWVIGEKGEDGG